MKKEKHIQGIHERHNREMELRGGNCGHRWPGGPANGSDAPAAPQAPYFEDGDIWRSELLKRQPLKANPVGDERTVKRSELTRMDTMDIVDLKRRTEEELEKRSWAKALENLNTMDLADLSVAIGERLGKKGLNTSSKPSTPPLAPPSRNKRNVTILTRV